MKLGCSGMAKFPKASRERPRRRVTAQSIALNCTLWSGSRPLIKTLSATKRELKIRRHIRVLGPLVSMPWFAAVLTINFSNTPATKATGRASCCIRRGGSTSTHLRSISPSEDRILPRRRLYAKTDFVRGGSRCNREYQSRAGSGAPLVYGRVRCEQARNAKRKSHENSIDQSTLVDIRDRG